MLIDTHAHVNFKGFENDAIEVMQRALSAGVSVINVGTQFDTSKAAVEMAEQLSAFAKASADRRVTGNESRVYAVVGLHPVHTYSQHLDEEETSFNTREEKFDYEAYKKLASNQLVVGIGECGLDYFRLPADGHLLQGAEDAHLHIKQLQKDAFILQLKLAKELNKTLVIHSRSSKGTDDACLDILEILKTPSLWRHSEGVRPTEESEKQKEILRFAQNDAVLPRFVLHSYTGSPEVAKMFVDLGGYISFNGIITFDKTGNQEAVLKVVPEDKIVLETDCPYLTPVPMRGKKNEPLYVRYVAEHVARVKGLSVDKVAETTLENSRRLFQIE